MVVGLKDVTGPLRPSRAAGPGRWVDAGRDVRVTGILGGFVRPVVADDDLALRAVAGL